MHNVETTHFHRRKLPHWEIRNGEYFVTTRLADSLPRSAVEKISLLHHEIASAPSGSDIVTNLQRRYFRTLEKYLDAGTGECLLKRDNIAAIVERELAALSEWDVDIPHFTIMPNHLHGLVAPRERCVRNLSEIMKRLKGRSAHQIRAALGGSGPIWQREWFDHWIRDEAERLRIIEYIRENPAKAKLVQRWEDHRWTR
ncbi:MAG: transposase [Verrucomicrobia bacterium]|nr:transposase [Verrucomicrobiota bacterium]